ncbi:PAS domain S-box-containing protein [Bryocella elongata]|uniref:histidine kinase n=1 Tax=Bryocella elongata TaxID=863522 RepID=A0A1H5TLB5_9BACT|nr:PAS domain-containing sensor histidine kinase [Bryocella elongata]SEF63549.1 PAS domain S-box-containing protein [Bryocella elongata]
MIQALSVLAVSLLTHFSPSMVGLSAVVAGAVVLWVGRQLLRQEREIDEAGRRSDVIFEQLSEGVVLIDHVRNLATMNKAAARILGVSGPAVAHSELRRGYEVLSSEGRPLPESEWPSSLAAKGRYVRSLELQLIRKSHGDVRYVEVSSSPIHNHKGVSTSTLLTYRDITEARRAALARERLASIVDSSDDAIIGKDVDGIVTSWNRGAEKVFGYSAEEMLGRSIRILIPEGLVSEEDDILSRIRSGETVEHMETERRRKDGSLIQVSATISPIRDSFGNIIGASKIARDITERRRLERQLRQSRKLEALGQLTGGVAHDFNNLLGIILGNLELLGEMLEGNEAALGRVRSVERAAGRGASLARRMLAFSSREELSPARATLSDLVNSTLELATRALGPEIDIIPSLDETTPPVFVDSAALQNALLNLLVNARDAMPKGGSITITTHVAHLDDAYPPVVAGELKAGSYACLSVSDTGHGMSAEVLEHVFEPFFTTKSRDKGTGLGLAMVYGFARQSGGTVRIYSEPGYGTTVSLYLPLSDDDAQAYPQLEDSSDDIVIGNGVALVVDDESDLLEVAVSYLRALGYSAVGVSGPAQALEMLTRQKVDLVITDIIMPGGMNGVELIEKLRQMQCDIRVVYCSGFPADALAERRMLHLDGPLLHKPYQRREFIAAIRKVRAQSPSAEMRAPLL